MIRVTILGAGSIVPSEKRFGSGLYIETEVSKLLIDPGPGTIYKLVRIHVNPLSLTAVLVTHFHLDHVSDLLLLMMMWCYDEEGKPSKQPRPLNIIGPTGLQKLIEQAISIDAFSYLEKPMHVKRFLQIDEMRHGDIKQVGDSRIIAAEVEHLNGLAYRIEHKGKSIVYSGDTVPDQRLVDLARNCDLLIHECSFPHQQLIGKHTSEKQLAEITAQARPRKTVVTHLYPSWAGREHEIIEALKQAGIASENVFVAEDLLTVDV
ncbi:MAG: ribonuclease Z [Candidatus Caldarchaeum sp.]